MYNINQGVTEYPTYNTSKAQWLTAALNITDRLVKVYEPGVPDATTIGVSGLEISFPGWRVSRYTYVNLVIRITPTMMYIIEEDADDEAHTYEIWNSALFPSILDMYDSITSLIIANIKEYN